MTSSPLRLGFIGLGIMGAPMCGHLIAAGHQLFVHTRGKVAPAIADSSATQCTTARGVAERADIVFLMLPDTPDVEKVLFGADGVAQGLKGSAGKIVVDMSSISPVATKDFARRIEAVGAQYLDAPVSGGEVGAKNATLSIMVGGPEATFERVKPLLLHMGKTVTRIGDTGAGQVAKSCNKIAITGTIMAVAEAIHFARAAGVDPAPIREALLGGFAGSKILEIHGNRMLTNDYAPGFKTVLHKKDMGIVNDIAHELHMKAPISELGLEALNQAMDAGYGELDSSALFKLGDKK